MSDEGNVHENVENLSDMKQLKESDKKKKESKSTEKPKEKSKEKSKNAQSRESAAKKSREKPPRHRDRDEQRTVKSRRIIDDNNSLSFQPNEDAYKDIVSYIERAEKTRKDTSGLKIIAVSHAERMPDAFPDWVRFALRDGKYQPYDLNMPCTIKTRPQFHHRWDPMLTEVGIVAAQIYGKGLKASKLEPYNIYCSPEMACVQTASTMIDGMGNTFSMIYIEPALAKWGATLPTNIQRIWIQPEIYSEMGYHVAETYHPMVKYEDFPEMETALEFENRIAAFVDEASDTTDKTIVFVAHSAVVSLIRNHKLSSAEEAADDRLIPLDAVCIDIVSKKATVSENPLMQFTRINNAMRRLASNEVVMTGVE